MSGNTERFNGRVEEYVRFRAEYPAAALLGFLREACGLTLAWRVADVAAGTGMLTEVFLGNGNPVVAVEPNAEMRAVCAGLRGRWPENGGGGRDGGGDRAGGGIGRDGDGGAGVSLV